jgi:hypothetical protein
MSKSGTLGLFLIRNVSEAYDPINFFRSTNFLQAFSSGYDHKKDFRLDFTCAVSKESKKTNYGHEMIRNSILMKIQVKKTVFGI